MSWLLLVSLSDRWVEWALVVVGGLVVMYFVIASFYVVMTLAMVLLALLAYLWAVAWFSVSMLVLYPATQVLAVTHRLRHGSWPDRAPRI